MGMADAANLGNAHGKITLDPSGVLAGMREAQDAARRGFQGMSQSLQSVGQNLTNIGSSMTQLMLPVTALGAVGLRAYGKLDDALAEIQARTGAMPDQMDAVRAKAIQMGQDTAFSATDASNAMLQLLSSGYDLEETFAALPAVLDAAAAGGLDLGYTADVVTDALAMWNMEATQATQVSDALARGAAASSAEINDLAQGLGNVGPMANEMGLGLEDTIAILSAFSERGIKGAEAGTQLRSMLTNMTKDTDKVTGMWDQLGIALFDAEGNMRPLANIMGELRVEMDGMSDQERLNVIKTLGGAYGQMGLSVLTSTDAMGDMLGLMGEQADAATVARARLSSLNGMVSQMTSSLQTGLIVAMTGFIENSLKPSIQWVTRLLNKLTAWMMANPALVNSIVEVLAVMAAVGPGLMAIGKAISLVGNLIGLLTAGPLGLLVLAIGALYAAWKADLGGIQKITKKVLGPVIDTIQYIAYWLGEAFKAGESEGGFFGGLIAAFEALFYVFQDGETTFFSKFFESLGIAGDQAKKMGLAIVQAKDYVAEALRGMAEAITPLLPVIRDALLGAFQAFVEFIVDRALPVLAMVAGWFVNDLLPAVQEVLVNSVMPLVASFFDFLAQAWEIVGPALGQVFDWFVTTALPAILQFISGTVVPAVGVLIDILADIWEFVAPYLLEFLDWFVNTGMPAVIKFIEDDLVPAIEELIEWLGKVWEDVEPHLESLRDWFVETAAPAIKDFIENTLVPALEALWGTLTDLWDQAQPKLESLREWFVDTAAPAIRDFVNNTLRPAISDLIDTLKDVWDQVRPKLESLRGWWVDTAAPAIRNFIENTLKPAFSTLTDILKDVWDQAGPKLEEFYNFMADKIGWLKENVIDPLIGAVEDLIGWIGQIKFPDIPNGWDIWNATGIGGVLPGRAGGGPITAGLPYLVGERGPELIVPGQSGTVIPNDQLGGTGDTYHLTVPVTIPAGMTPEQGRAVGDEIGVGILDRLQSKRRWQGGGVLSG